MKHKLIFVGIIFLANITISKRTKPSPFRDIKHRTTRAEIRFPRPKTRKMCVQMDQTLRARKKACFLRPDTGPCRADIIQWYFDVKQRNCFRFYWGGCQGNGNKFETQKECMGYCYMNTSTAYSKIPYFCSLTYDYGHCFGQYNRWTYHTLEKTCKRRIYSGCGGNQNNFETFQECMSTCRTAPNNSLQHYQQLTTCMPFFVPDLYEN